MLPGRPPQVTFSCTMPPEDALVAATSNALASPSNGTCAFQFWTAQVESFYCALEGCASERIVDYDRNTTRYACEKIKCRCVPGRFICGEDGSVGA